MDKFVAKANIEHYRRKLAEETDDTKRQTLARLLAEEETKLASLTRTFHCL
jgi:TnpA family transposase